MEKLLKGLAYLNQPLQLLLFPEGTDMDS